MPQILVVPLRDVNEVILFIDDSGRLVFQSKDKKRWEVIRLKEIPITHYDRGYSMGEDLICAIGVNVIWK